MDREMIGRCGTYCGVCEWRERMHCPGCQKAQGKVFWGTCAIAGCSLAKGLEHCGHCSDLPCEPLQKAFDHPEHGDNGERLLNLRGWAAGHETYLKLRTFG